MRHGERIVTPKLWVFKMTHHISPLPLNVLFKFLNPIIITSQDIR